MKTCTLPDCDAAHWAKGYCNAHYHRSRRYGDPYGAADPLERSSIHLEDVEFMADTGETFEGAAARLGVKPNSLIQHLARKGRRDLIRRFNHQLTA